MQSNKEEKVTATVRRMVFWDEPLEEIFHTLEVNGFSGQEARDIYDAARKERIADIRVDAFKRAAIGGTSIVGAIILLAVNLSSGGIGRGGFVAIFGACVFGLWKLIDGGYTFLNAPSKKGSLADHDE